jgi:hypothetical protein
MATAAKVPDAPKAVVSAPAANGAVTCSKCDGALDTTGYPHWCKRCQNAYRKEYGATKNEMQETRGYAAGVSAMREFLATNFEAYLPPRIFTGAEIAHIVRTCGEPVAP